MNSSSPRSIDDYLQALQAALAGADPALIQDALYDSEEHLRAEAAANPEMSEAEVLEQIARSYGAPDEVAAAYLDTEAKVNAALQPPMTRGVQSPNLLSRYFSVYADPRAYVSLFFMLLSLVTGIFYFIFAVTGLALSLGLAILIIGLPVFLGFIGITRVMSLAEGRLLEAVSGERMPRRPVHPGVPQGLVARSLEMLRDTHLPSGDAAARSHLLRHCGHRARARREFRLRAGRGHGAAFRLVGAVGERRFDRVQSGVDRYARWLGVRRRLRRRRPDDSSAFRAHHRQRPRTHRQDAAGGARRVTL
jgi:uncharacterized membrane protein